MTVTTFSFAYSGGIEDWVVPFHTGTIWVDVVGGYGGREQSHPGGAGGRPGTISGKATIAAGTVLHLIVGQSGGGGPTGVAGGPSLGRAGGYPRGGAASEVRIGGTSLADTKIVAGGGGGAEAGYHGSAGGAGGSGMAAGSGADPGTLTGPGSGASGGNGATGNGGGGGGYYGGGSRSGGSSWLDTTLFTAVSPVIPTGPFIKITLDYLGPWVPPTDGWSVGFLKF